MGWHAFFLSKSADRYSPEGLYKIIKAKLPDSAEVFVPGRSVGHRSIELFDGYVFVRGASKKTLARLQSLEIIQSRITSDSLLVSDEEIQRLQALLEDTSDIKVSPGDHARIMAGPAKDVEAIVFQVESDTVYAFLDFVFMLQPAVLAKGDIEVIQSPNKLLIDGPSLFLRSIYAPKMLSKGGAEVQGIYWFISWMNRIKEEFPHHEIYVVWGDSPGMPKSQWDNLPKETRESSLEQLKAVKWLLRCFPVFQVFADNLDSWNVLANLVDHFSNHNAVIVTHDKDLYSVVSDRVVLAVPSGDGFEIVDEEVVIKATGGVPPNRIQMFLALHGNPAKDIPQAVKIPASSMIKLCLSAETVGDLIGKASEVLTENEAKEVVANSSKILDNFDKIQYSQVVQSVVQAGTLALRPVKDAFMEFGFEGFLQEFHRFSQLWDKAGQIKFGLSAATVDSAYVQSPGSCMNVLEQPPF